MNTFASARPAVAPRLLLAVTALFAVWVLTALALVDPARANGGGHLPKIASGTSHTCALADDGSVKCWGANAAGQLGNGGTSETATPTPIAGVVAAKNNSTPSVPTLGKVETLAASSNATCAISSGSIWCWGSNASGELGGGSTDADPHPAPQLIAGAKGFYAITAGNDHFCAVNWDGLMSCWGSNAAGQIGTGAVGGTINAPTAVPGIKKFKSIAAGGAFTCVVLETTQPKCWGDGNGTPTDVAGLKDVYELVAGAASACALGWSDVALRCWPGAAPDSLTNVDGLFEIKALGGTSNSNCAVARTLTAANSKPLSADHSLQCWGDNSAGQLGTGDNTSSPTPRLVKLSEVAELSSGAAATKQCAIVRGGDPYCWGGGVNLPTKVEGLDLVTQPQYPEWASITPKSRLKLNKAGTHWKVSSKVAVEPSALSFASEACAGRIVGSAYFYKRMGKKAAAAGGVEYKKVGVRTMTKLRRAGDYCKADFTIKIPLSRFGDKKKRLLIGASSFGNKSMAPFSTEFAIKDLKKILKGK